VGWLVVKSLPALTYTVEDDHEPGQRISPPPAEDGVEHQANQDGTSQIGIDQRDSAFCLQDRVVERRACTSFPVRQAQHRDTHHRRPGDAERRRRRTGAHGEEIRRLRSDVDRKRDKSAADYSHGGPFPLTAGVGQLPHDHGRCKDLDEGIQAEAGQGHRLCGQRGNRQDHHPDDVPAERQVLKPEASLQ
jgi:hypothetical protein